jgi:hypothetical protein
MRGKFRCLKMRREDTIENGKTMEWMKREISGYFVRYLCLKM